MHARRDSDTEAESFWSVIRLPHSSLRPGLRGHPAPQEAAGDPGESFFLGNSGHQGFQPSTDFPLCHAAVELVVKTLSCYCSPNEHMPVAFVILNPFDVSVLHVIDSDLGCSEQGSGLEGVGKLSAPARPACWVPASGPGVRAGRQARCKGRACRPRV